MGVGHKLVCRKCGYQFDARFGVGYTFPLVYQETIRAGKEGKLGKDIQGFLLKHPDGALNCEEVMLLCTSCGELVMGQDLSMYIPQNTQAATDNGRALSAEDASYVGPGELKRNYRLAKRHEHLCEKCGGTMRIVDEMDLFPEVEEEVPEGEDLPSCVNCPQCHETLMLAGDYLFD